MNNPGRKTQRVVIVGGGIAGLSTAVRLNQAGLPVTVLEASQIGAGASTRNQGWLHSGAWFAPADADLANQCYYSLEQTIQFCPDCFEPHHRGMAYVFSRPDTRATQWTQAWNRADIPYEDLDLDELFGELPSLDKSTTQRAFLLPDRSIRTDVLLTRLAATAENCGVELRTDTAVIHIQRDDNRATGVVTGPGEEIPAALVVLAGGAIGTRLWSDLVGAKSRAGQQPEFTRVALKTHLVGIKPEVGRMPFCVVDADGFNHIPHAPTSVFGLNRWLPVGDPSDQQVVGAEIERIWTQIERFFPELDRSGLDVTEWAGTTVEAMHVDQVEPAVAPRPTVIDHSLESPAIENLVSLFPGRATLWAALAEQARKLILAKLEHSPVSAASPPWEAPAPDTPRRGQ